MRFPASENARRRPGQPVWPVRMLPCSQPVCAGAVAGRLLFMLQRLPGSRTPAANHGEAPCIHPFNPLGGRVNHKPAFDRSAQFLGLSVQTFSGFCCRQRRLFTGTWSGAPVHSRNGPLVGSSGCFGCRCRATCLSPGRGDDRFPAGLQSMEGRHCRWPLRGRNRIPDQLEEVRFRRQGTRGPGGRRCPSRPRRFEPHIRGCQQRACH